MTPEELYLKLLVSGADADAVAYINALTAAGVSPSGTQQSAINALVVALKQAGVWSKLLALYPYVGGTAATHAVNAKTPGSYTIAWHGTLTHSANGVQGDGTSGYGDTGLNAASVFGSSHLTALGVYSRTQSRSTNDAGEMGVSDGGQLLLRLDAAGTAYPVHIISSYDESNPSSFGMTNGFWIGSQPSATSAKIYREGTLFNAGTVSGSSSAPSRNLYLHCYNYTGSAIRFSPRQHALAFVGSALSDAEVAAASAAVQQFQTTLGRALAKSVVGFVGDSLTSGYCSDTSVTPNTSSASYACYNATVAHAHPFVAVNRGIDGSKSADWVGGSSNLNAALSAFQSAGVQTVLVTLGTNDSANAVSGATYQSNLASLCSALNAAGMTVVLNQPPYSSDAGHSTTLLQAYQTSIGNLVNGTTIKQGDTSAYTYFSTHTSELQADGVHPNNTGVRTLGTLWGNVL